MRKIIPSVFIFINLLFCSDINYLLVVSFDGFRSDYIERVPTPNFDKLARLGTKAESLIPVFPSLTFPNHYSIATGSYADKHNITGNIFFDKSKNMEYSLRKPATVRDPEFYKSEPIWVTAERQGVKAAAFYWVGTEAPIKNYLPSIFKYYDGSVLFKDRVDSVITWLELEEEHRPQLTMLYFSEPDYIGHNLGANHKDVEKKISEMDELLGYLLSSLKKLPIYKFINILVLSDHGMVDVSKDRLIILDNYLFINDNLKIYGSGALAQISINNHLNKDILESKINIIPHIKYWKKKNIPSRFHFSNNNTMDYLLLADEGWYITTNKDLDSKPFDLGGMHGYDPSLPSMHGIFYAIGPKIKNNYYIDSFENIHIYPLMCQLLNIKPYSNTKDGPDGQLEVLKKIMINN